MAQAEAPLWDFAAVRAGRAFFARMRRALAFAYEILQTNKNQAKQFFLRTGFAKKRVFVCLFVLAGTGRHVLLLNIGTNDFILPLGRPVRLRSGARAPARTPISEASRDPRSC